MNICCCQLAGTQACEDCPNNKMMPQWEFRTNYFQPKEIIKEKYDNKGRLIEKIIEYEF